MDTVPYHIHGMIFQFIFGVFCGNREQREKQTNEIDLHLLPYGKLTDLKTSVDWKTCCSHDQYQFSLNVLAPWILRGPVKYSSNRK